VSIRKVWINFESFLILFYCFVVSPNEAVGITESDPVDQRQGIKFEHCFVLLKTFLKSSHRIEIDCVLRARLDAAWIDFEGPQVFLFCA
jgi:hypothetical protein